MVGALKAEIEAYVQTNSGVEVAGRMTTKCQIEQEYWPRESSRSSENPGAGRKSAKAHSSILGRNHFPKTNVPGAA